MATLFEQCEAFEKLAQDKGILNLISGCKNGIAAEVASGIKKINALITTSKEAAESEAIQKLDDILGRINGTAQELTVESAKRVQASLQTIIGQALFFTSPQNAGMGYDPLTASGGGNSIQAVVNRINSYCQKLAAGLKSIPA